MILSNGSALYDFQAGRMVYETFLPERVGQDLCQLARDIPEIGFEAYHGDDIYAYQPNAVTEAHITRAKAHYTQLPIAQMPQPWSKVILEQDTSVLRRVQEYMLARWSDHYEVIFSNAYLLELTRKGSHKGGMVRYLADRLGIQPGHIYCVGDNQERPSPCWPSPPSPLPPATAPRPSRTGAPSSSAPAGRGASLRLWSVWTSSIKFRRLRLSPGPP